MGGSLIVTSEVAVIEDEKDRIKLILENFGEAEASDLFGYEVANMMTKVSEIETRFERIMR
eukprot:scaffold178878_cov10-Tisochrysis_lutea.AAC.1